MRLKANCGRQFFYSRNRELVEVKGGDEISADTLKEFDIPVELIDFDEPERPFCPSPLATDKPAAPEENKRQALAANVLGDRKA